MRHVTHDLTAHAATGGADQHWTYSLPKDINDGDVRLPLDVLPEDSSNDNIRPAPDAACSSPVVEEPDDSDFDFPPPVGRPKPNCSAPDDDSDSDSDASLEHAPATRKPHAAQRSKDTVAVDPGQVGPRMHACWQCTRMAMARRGTTVAGI